MTKKKVPFELTRLDRDQLRAIKNALEHHARRYGKGTRVVLDLPGGLLEAWLEVLRRAGHPTRADLLEFRQELVEDYRNEGLALTAAVRKAKEEAAGLGDLVLGRTIPFGEDSTLVSNLSRARKKPRRG